VTRALAEAARATLYGVALACGSLAMTDPAHSGPITRADLCVTLGAVATEPDGRMSVTVPKMRAFVLPSTRPAEEVRFTYNGPTVESAPLGSGQLRRQFGLKLRAQDSCNVIYVMWRIAPRAQLVVSIKRNPGRHTHAQCGTRGYRNLKPQRRAEVAVIRPGSTHSLQAGIQGRTLRVVADGAEAWIGTLGAQSFDGPIGLRSDNVSVAFDIDAAVTGAPGSGVRPCPARPVDED